MGRLRVLTHHPKHVEEICRVLSQKHGVQDEIVAVSLLV